MLSPQSAVTNGLPFAPAPNIIFANWREALHLSGLSPGIKSLYAQAIAGYLDYYVHNAASVRAFMSDAEQRGLAKQPQLWKEGLNWFFRAGRRRCASGKPLEVPTPGQADTGAEPWERRLIERLRIQHYAWRSERTYREWAWRLRDLVLPRQLESATGEDIKAFLSEPAVKGRVAIATQKQALNALVFLFREALLFARSPGLCATILLGLDALFCNRRADFCPPFEPVRGSTGLQGLTLFYPRLPS